MCKKRTNMWNKWDGSKIIIRMIVEQGTNKRNDDQLISKHGEEPHHQQMRWWRGQWLGVPKRKAFIFHTQKDVAKWIQIKESLKKLTYKLSPTNILNEVTLKCIYMLKWEEYYVNTHNALILSFFFLVFFWFFYIINAHTVNMNKWTPIRKHDKWMHS